MIVLVSLLISFLASIIGAVCGIGGGIIIKPVLDLTGLMSVESISFLSSCTVLSMSSYSVLKTMRSDSKGIDYKTGSFLAIGAIIGGIAGKTLFSIIVREMGSAVIAGKIQAITLAIITVFTILYIIFKERITTKLITSTLVMTIIGFVLGMVSSFLGIGGGPINIIVLMYFFGMSSKVAAQNSLFIIFFSQLSTLFTTLFTKTVPEFNSLVLAVMILGGITGGIVGRYIYRKVDDKKIDTLLLGVMCLIVIISIINAIRL